MFETIFWILVFLILYPFMIYPIILYLIGIWRPMPENINIVQSKPVSVTMIMSAYNEEKTIKEKLMNCLMLDYPSIQILIGNDGSTDNTSKIIKQFIKDEKNIEYYEFERQGKNNVLNNLWKYVKGEVVVFSDANSIYTGDAITRLVSNFNNPYVGLVCGKLKYNPSENGSEGIYWHYENMVKRLESRIGELLVANGAIFAIRKELFKELKNNVANDFQTPHDIHSHGYYLIYEPKAIAFEDTSKSLYSEYKRKVRIIHRGYNGFFSLKHDFLSLRFFELISHKLLRWLSGYFMAALFGINLILAYNSLFYKIVMLLQLIFYITAVTGLIFERYKIPIVKLCSYILIIQISSIMGLGYYENEEENQNWEVER